MNTKLLKIIAVSVCLAWLAPSLALAQPVITVQPADQFLAPGQNARFSIAARGSVTLQWLFDGLVIAGATGYSLSVTNAQSAQGYYSVIVSNASGSVTSQVARLKVFLSNPTAHSLSGIDTQADGSVGLTFKGETTLLFAPYDDLYPLEASQNLVDWMPVALLLRTNGEPGPLHFVDSDAPKFSQRFYRTPTNALLTPNPQPTGPYSVGTFSMMLTDPSRTNKVLRTNYQFMITFWYPAVAQAGVFPALFVDKQVAMCGVYVIAGGSSWSNRLVAFFSHSLSDAPLATNLVKCPVVLYSPGWTGQRRDNTDKVEDLASWGYVVVGLDHRDTYLSVLPDGTLLHGQNKLTDTLNAIPTIEDRLRDEQLVLDELQSLNANDPRLGGRLDLDKIGAFGFSLGGSTAAQLCLRDPRCKAGAHFDAPYYESNMLTQTLSVPFLFFCEDDSPSDESPPNSDELPVFNHMVTNAYWVKLKSTNHGCFSDWDLILDSASMASGWGTPVSGQFLPPARVSQIVRAYLLSFFNKYLRGEDDHLLDGPSPAYPEVEQFLKK